MIVTSFHNDVTYIISMSHSMDKMYSIQDRCIYPPYTVSSKNFPITIKMKKKYKIFKTLNNSQSKLKMSNFQKNSKT